MRPRNRVLRRATTSVYRPLHTAMIDSLESRRMMDATYHNLGSGAFTQDWTNTSQITTNDNWSGVPSIVGFLSGLGTASGTNPSTITGTSTTIDVNANQTNPNTFTAGGVTEFELANPSIGMQGSNSAGSPYIQLHVNSTGVNSVDVKYNVRDLDSSADNATQAVALQYRTSPSGTWTNVPAAFIADATTVSTATQVTPVSVTLPGDAGNQPQLQVRILTGNAAGNDEAVGIDDIVVNATPLQTPPGAFQVDARGVRVYEDAGFAIVTVTRQGGTGGAVTVDYSTADQTATSGSDYTSTSGTLQFADGQETADIQIPLNNDNQDELAESFTLTISNPTGGATLNPSTSSVVTIVDADGQALVKGPLVQDWSNTDLISASDNWYNVPNIIGYLSDADRDAGVVDVIANQTNPGGQSQGGVAEFDAIGNPSIALQGSNAAANPQIILDVDSRGVSNVNVAFDALDLDGSADNATQPISVSYRIGNSGDFQEFYSIEDATTGPSLADLVTNVSTALPADAIGNQLVQIRISTGNAGGNDEWVGIDNINISADAVGGTAPTLNGSTFAFETAQSMSLTFDQNIQDTLESADIAVVNITTGQTIPSTAWTLTTDNSGSSSVATVAFTGVLPDGNYEIRVLANSISASSGPSNTAELKGSFYVMAGDANRDRHVNFDDLIVLAQNYNKAGKTFSEGNFNYNAGGNVNFDDLIILAQKYNTAITAPAIAAVNSLQAPAPVTKKREPAASTIV